MLRSALGLILIGAAFGQQAPPSPVAQTNVKALQNALRNLKFPPAPAVTTENESARRNGCGHLRIIRPDPEIDPKMIVPGFDNNVTRSRMPVYKGMPPCQSER